MNWKAIKNFPNYEVSDEGYVHNRDHFMKLQSHKPKGYLAVILYNGSQKRFLVHRLVAIAFLPNPRRYPMVLHKDNNPKNNRHTNLYWGTAKHNTADCIKAGNFARGEKVSNSKLTVDDVISIRTMKNAYTQRELAHLYDVSRGHISMIQQGKRWSHVNISS